MYSLSDIQKLVQMLAFLGITAPGSYPAHSVVLGAGANAAPGAAGTLLGSNGASADPSFQTLAALGIQPAGTYAPLPLPAASVGASQLGANVVGDGQLAWGNVLGRVCDSVAALSALNISIYTRAFVTGYYAAGDGGGGSYYYSAGSSATVNGGTVLAAAGGVGRWLLSYTGILSVKQFGAHGNSSTDDTAPIQAAITAVQGLGRPGRLYLPAGGYVISANLSITAGISIIGDGINSTVINPSISTIAFAINTAQACSIEGLFIDYITAQNSGLYAITITAPSTTANSITKLRDLQIAGADSGIQFTKSAFFLIDHCFVENFINFGVQVSNALDIDVGDSIITNCTFFNFSASGGAGINFLSSGGLRIENNKFGALAEGVLFQYATNAGSTAPNTAQLIITGNSFDTMSSAAISISRQTNTDTFNSIIIANNVMPDCGVGVSIPHDANGVWLSSVIITGNTYLSPGSGSPVGVSVDSTTTLNVTNNTFYSQNVNTVGVTIGASVTGGLVQLNNLASSPSAFATTIFNGGTNVIVANNVT